MAAAKPTIFSGTGKDLIPLVTQLIANDGELADPISAFKPLIDDLIDVDNLKQDAKFIKDKIKSLIPINLENWPIANKTVNKVFMDMTGVNISDGMSGKELRRIGNMAKNERFSKDAIRQKYSFGEDIEAYEVMKVVDAVKKAKIPIPGALAQQQDETTAIPFADKYASVSNYTTAWASLLDQVRGLKLYDAYDTLMEALIGDDAAILAVYDQLPLVILEGEIAPLLSIERIVPVTEMVARYPTLIEDFLVHFAVPNTDHQTVYQTILAFFQRSVVNGDWHTEEFDGTMVLKSRLFANVNKETARFFLSNATNDQHILNMVSVGYVYNEDNFSVPSRLTSNTKGVKLQYLNGLFR